MKKIIKLKCDKYLKTMKIACHDIVEHTVNMSFDEFVNAKAQRQATSLNLLIIGEMAAKLINLKVPDIDESFLAELHKARGLRNLLAHQYDDIELLSIYKTAIVYIPELIKNIEVTQIQLVNRENETYLSDKYKDGDIER